MNDRERLESLVDRIRSFEGLDEERYQRLTAEIDRPAGRFGYDEDGRLKVALFGASRTTSSPSRRATTVASRSNPSRRR